MFSFLPKEKNINPVFESLLDFRQIVQNLTRPTMKHLEQMVMMMMIMMITTMMMMVVARGFQEHSALAARNWAERRLWRRSEEYKNFSS